METHLAVWHGTSQESAALVEAVAGNCNCTFGRTGERNAVCAAHRMLVEDQRALDGLVFACRLKSRLLDEEWRVSRIERRWAR
jgi:hypothetical protein